MMLGPVLILFASQVLLPNASPTDADDLHENYLQASRPFFLFLAASQLWVNGVDLILRDGLTRWGLLNGVAVIFALILAFSRSRPVHLLMTTAMWLLFLITWTLRSMG